MKKDTKRIVLTSLLFLFVGVLGWYASVYLYYAMDILIDGRWPNSDIQAYMQFVFLFVIVFVGMAGTSAGLRMKIKKEQDKREVVERQLVEANHAIEELNASIAAYRTLDPEHGTWSMEMFRPFVKSFKERHIWNLATCRVDCQDTDAADRLAMASKYILGTDVLRFEAGPLVYIYLFPGCTREEMEGYMKTVLQDGAKITRAYVHDTTVDTPEDTERALGIGGKEPSCKTV
jgi:hypothetical protein